MGSRWRGIYESVSRLGSNPAVFDVRGRSGRKRRTVETSCFAQLHTSSLVTFTQSVDKENRNGDQDTNDDRRYEKDGVSCHPAPAALAGFCHPAGLVAGDVSADAVTTQVDIESGWPPSR